MVPTTIEEAAALHYSIAVQCRCGNKASFNAMGLWWRFQRKYWDQRFGPARSKFFCRKCSAKGGRKVRPVKIETVRVTLAADVMLPFPPEQEWKRAMSRVR